jgi:hypothetical protein
VSENNALKMLGKVILNQKEFIVLVIQNNLMHVLFQYEQDL